MKLRDLILMIIGFVEGIFSYGSTSVTNYFDEYITSNDSEKKKEIEELKSKSIKIMVDLTSVKIKSTNSTHVAYFRYSINNKMKFYKKKFSMDLVNLQLGFISQKQTFIYLNPYNLKVNYLDLEFMEK